MADLTTKQQLAAFDNRRHPPMREQIRNTIRTLIAQRYAIYHPDIDAYEITEAGRARIKREEEGADSYPDAPD